MFVNTRNRSTQEEIMDDLSMEGELLRKTLDQIAAINQWLGGNQATIKGVNTLLKNQSKDKVVSIVDLGCGSGDMLRALAEFGRTHHYKFKLTGIDANEYSINHARKLSVNYPEISYAQMDIWSDEFSGMYFDIALATLFLHHFTEQQIEALLLPVVEKAGIGVVVNDLHRSRIAYYLFKGLCLFIKNPMVKQDGAVSILRGFKKKELISTSKKIKDSVSAIQWKWAFRYQWIIKKVWQ